MIFPHAKLAQGRGLPFSMYSTVLDGKGWHTFISQVNLDFIYKSMSMKFRDHCEHLVCGAVYIFFVIRIELWRISLYRFSHESCLCEKSAVVLNLTFESIQAV